MHRQTINGTITAATNHGLDDQVPDFLFGTNITEDTINGFGGNDRLFGLAGHDTINGGFGNDLIVGGADWDTLTGGAGADTFAFAKHDSGPNYWQADVITDFNAGEGDKIRLGANHFSSGSQYIEQKIFNDGNHVDNYNLALSFAKSHMGGDVQAIFCTDGKDGYLFADIDHNGLVDTGIELPGLNDITDFSWRNLT